MLRRRALILLAAIACVVLACGFSGAEGKSPLRILFVGNSLTSWNNLPAFVAAIARKSGDTTLTYRMIAPPAVSLEDHWSIQRTRAALAEERWDAVVFQQGPSAEAAGRLHLCTWTQRFADEARARGAQPYLLGVWSAGRFGIQEVIDSYAAAAEAADVPLLPAGSAWADAWKRKRAIALHARDGLHPSRLGAYLAALVVYGGLRDVSPLGLPSSLVVAKKRFTTTRGNVAILQAAAQEALAAGAEAGPCRI